MKAHGFTLIEIIATLLVVSILAGTILFFIEGPVKGFVQQNRRAQVVAAANAALDRMVGEIQGALPNSVRVANPGGTPGSCADCRVLQLIPIVDAGRYRDGPSSNFPQQQYSLQFNQADTQWNIESPLNAVTLPSPASTADRLVIYNTGQPGADAYTQSPSASSGVITTQGDSVQIAPVTHGGVTENQVTLGSGFQFAYGSPQQRIYLVHQSTAWLCHPNAVAPDNGTLRRYASPIQAAVPATTSLGDPAVSGVTQCSFQYQPGTATRSGLATIEITLTQGRNTVHLVRQVHVNNVP